MFYCMLEKVKEYKHNNQTLLFDKDTKTYSLISYSTEVLRVVNGYTVLDEYSKISTTTSKHITQAKNFLGI